MLTNLNSDGPSFLQAANLGVPVVRAKVKVHSVLACHRLAGGHECGSRCPHRVNEEIPAEGPVQACSRLRTDRQNSLIRLGHCASQSGRNR